MTGLGFYAPLKPPTHPTPSGDRAMARGVIKALDIAGYTVDLASDLRSYDGQGDEATQARIAAGAKTEIARILSAAPNWVAWVTYHSYYKSPDLIGPAVCAALGIPYLQIESTRAKSRLTGAWANFAKATEIASDQAQAVLFMTTRDRQALDDHKPMDQKLVHLPPFLQTDVLPKQAMPSGPNILSIGMFRERAKLASYRLIAQTLPLLETPEWHLTIIGDGPERDTIEPLFAPFGARVRMTGALEQDQVQAHLGNARALLWPGVDEAYGMVYLEAQAAGVPVVAQDRDGVRDVLAQAGCDPKAGAQGMAARLDKLLSDDDSYRQAADMARDNVQRMHLLPKAALILRQTIEDLT